MKKKAKQVKWTEAEEEELRKLLERNFTILTCPMEKDIRKATQQSKQNGAAFMSAIGKQLKKANNMMLKLKKNQA